jgi:hypothetical protein
MAELTDNDDLIRPAIRYQGLNMRINKHKSHMVTSNSICVQSLSHVVQSMSLSNFYNIMSAVPIYTCQSCKNQRL